MSSGERGEDCRREVYVERFFKNESFIFSDISNLEFKQKLYGAISTNGLTIWNIWKNEPLKINLSTLKNLSA